MKTYKRKESLQLSFLKLTQGYKLHENLKRKRKLKKEPVIPVELQHHSRENLSCENGVWFWVPTPAQIELGCMALREAQDLEVASSKKKHNVVHEFLTDLDRALLANRLVRVTDLLLNKRDSVPGPADTDSQLFDNWNSDYEAP